MSEENKPGMRFYYALIYFGLYGGALLNVVVGMRYFSGRIYETPYTHASDIYALFPALRYMNWGYGIVSILMGFFAIYVRNQLKDFKKNGPTMYYVLLGSMIVTPLVYLLGTLLLYGSEVSLGSWLEYAAELATQCIALYASHIYFHKRESLFNQ